MMEKKIVEFILQCKKTPKLTYFMKEYLMNLFYGVNRPVQALQ